jgi:hypothetical protein
MDYSDCLGYQLGFCRLRCTKPESCDDFKSKSKLIVLPCGVGDTVWYITGIGRNLIKPAKIEEIIIDKDGIKDLYVQGDSCSFENSFDIFYTTKEEAQRALEGDSKEATDNV